MKIVRIILATSIIAAANLAFATSYACNSTYCCPTNLIGYGQQVYTNDDCQSNSGNTKCSFVIAPDWQNSPQLSPWNSTNDPHSYKNYISYPSNLFQSSQAAVNSLDSIITYTNNNGDGTTSLMCMYANTSNGQVIGYWLSNPSATYNNCVGNPGFYGFDCQTTK